MSGFSLECFTFGIGFLCCLGVLISLWGNIDNAFGDGQEEDWQANQGEKNIW